MTTRAGALLVALLLSSGLSPAQPQATRTDFFNGSGPMTLRLEAPLRDLFAKGAQDDKFSVPGKLSYKDPVSGADLARDAQVSVRGHTSRTEEECPFPKLKLKFADGGVLRVGTHCGETAGDTLSTKYGRLANENSPRREAVAYALLRAADVPTLRTRAATITYVDKDQPPLTRHALLVEDDDDARKRVNGTAAITMEKFGSVRTRDASADAGRISFGEAMIGNFDWCLKFTPDDIYRCDESKPLWNLLAFDRGDGKATLLAKDLDIAGVVVGRHGWFKTIFNPAYVPSKSEVEIEVLSQVQRTRVLFTRAELDALRRSFVDRKTALYAVVDQADVDDKGRAIARDYLDNFFKAITDDEAFYRPVVARNNVQIYLDAARTKEACRPKDVMRPGTPVNELQRSGSMSQVVILDAQWRWTADKRCETVQTSPVWIQSNAITVNFPAKD